MNLKYLPYITLISLFFGDIAISSVKIGRYKPSKTAIKVDQRRITGTGTRSECRSSVPEDKLELLVPKEEIAHKTVSKRPFLYLYYNQEQEIDLKFTLVDPKNANTIDSQKIQLKHKGIAKISLPSNIKLEENQIYLWNIAIPCKNNPSLNQEVLRAGIEKTVHNPETSRNINNAKSKTDEATIYAQNGIWYEALQKSLELNNESGCNKQAFNILLE